MDTRRYETVESLPAEREIYRPAPSRTLHDALVPGVRACIGGAFASLAVVAAARIIGQQPRSFEGWLWLLFCAFALTSAGIWIWSERRQEIIYLAEVVSQRNLDDNPAIGWPGQTIHPFVPNAGQERQNQEASDIIREQERFTEFIDACYDPHYGPSVQALTRAGFSPADPNEIERYRSDAINCGLLAWRNAANHNLGVRLVYDEDKAKAITARLMWVRGAGDKYPAPTPPMNVGW